MEKRVQDYSKEILKIIRSNTSPAVMGGRLQDYHENDLADVMPKLTVQERCKLYRILDTDMLSDIFEYTDEENAAEYLNEMDVKKAAAILSKMETDALADVLNKVEKTKKKILIDLLEPEVRRDVEMIASFDEDEIGSRMTTNYIVITDKLTVKQAMSSLIEQAAKNDTSTGNYERCCFLANQTADKIYGRSDRRRSQKAESTRSGEKRSLRKSASEGNYLCYGYTGNECLHGADRGLSYCRFCRNRTGADAGNAGTLSIL